MIEILNEGSDNVLAIKAKGTLTHDDYERFIPLLDVEIRDGSHVSMFVDITEFEGMTPHAMLDDFMTGIKYWFNFNLIAVVGDNKWEEYLIKFVSAVMPCEIRFFLPEDKDKAWAWLEDKA